MRFLLYFSVLLQGIEIGDENSLFDFMTDYKVSLNDQSRRIEQEKQVYQKNR
jgi:hypothetical protein